MFFWSLATEQTSRKAIHFLHCLRPKKKTRSETKACSTPLSNRWPPPPHSLSLPQLPLMHPLYTPTQSVSIIPPWETDTDNWSQIFVGRTQRDLLFTPKQLSTSHSPISSPHELRPLQRFPHSRRHHRTRAEPLSVPNTAPFTATIKPSGHMPLMTLTQSPFSSLLTPPGFSDICETFESVTGSLW